MRARQCLLAALLAQSAAVPAATLPATVPAPTPPAPVPAGVILVKGAWSSASDASTPIPESGQATAHDYTNRYFQFTYPFAPGWSRGFEGPPPSDRGYYVLAQIEPVAGHAGSLLIDAQDLFFATDTGRHLRADYAMERPAAEVSIAGHSFARLDYVSPAAGLHWTVLVTEIRCHRVQFTFTSADPKTLANLAAAMTLANRRETTPVCIKDYASSANVVSRVDPILTDRRFNSIPVRVVIDTGGKVKFIHVISAFPEQARVITDALRAWRFKPYVMNGKAVEVETGILLGVQPNRPLISGKQEPQLPPARRHDTTW